MILDVAFELFLERGYKGTSMNAIAGAAGVTKPVVYSCFASKSELFLALLDREEQRMLAQFGAALAEGLRHENLEEIFTAGFSAMLQAVIDTPQPYSMALVGAGEMDAVIDARVRNGRERQVAAIEPIARVWLEGQVPDERLDADAQFTAQTIVSIGEGGVRTLLAAPGKWTPKTLGRQMGRLAAKGYFSLADDLEPAG
jgi:AcrR family transcriptional regulator